MNYYSQPSNLASLSLNALEKEVTDRKIDLGKTLEETYHNIIDYDRLEIIKKEISELPDEKVSKGDRKRLRKAIAEKYPMIKVIVPSQEVLKEWEDKNIDYKIFQGSYGCIFYPAAKCDDKDSKGDLTDISKLINSKYANKQYVTKLLDVDNASHELKISSMLNKVDKDNVYVRTYKDERCNNILMPEKFLSKCKVYVKTLKKNKELKDDEKTKLVGVYMSYGGIDLATWMGKFNPSDFKFPENIICTMLVHAIEGLVLIHSVGIAHLDIKPDNLLVSTSHQLTYTDFGLAEYKDTYSSYFNTVYEPWPPDFILFDMTGGDVKSVRIENTIDKILRDNKSDYQPLDGLNKNTGKELLDIAIKMQSANSLEYLKTVDVYSLGIVFSELFFNMQMTPNKFVQDLLDKMTDLDPFKRIKEDKLLEYAGVLKMQLDKTL